MLHIYKLMKDMVWQREGKQTRPVCFSQANLDSNSGCTINCITFARLGFLICTVEKVIVCFKVAREIKYTFTHIEHIEQPQTQSKFSVNINFCFLFKYLKAIMGNMGTFIDLICVVFIESQHRIKPS